MQQNLFIANRGEIAVRVARSAADLGWNTVGVYSADDAGSNHLRAVDQPIALDGSGAAPYLDIDALVGLAVANSCTALHPGYGFLSENPELARACRDAGITFVGPTIDQLRLFGNKSAARQAAVSAGVSVLPGTESAVDLAAARAFVGEHGPSMIKAIAGGGGRGLRVVHTVAEVDHAYERCRSEARAGFGIADVFVEKLVDRPRHIEVQILGDGAGKAVHLGERDCSIQRRHQKIIEIAPAPGLPAELAAELHGAAVRLAESVDYRNAGTVEFLVSGEEFWFIETNARLQVEHTITEQVTGFDLVACQLRLANGESLADLGLGSAGSPKRMSIQLRVNIESMQPDGSVLPTGGTITTTEWPGGRGMRVDTFARAGMTTSPNFDSLLAKVIVTRDTTDLGVLGAAAVRALDETYVGGVSTNVAFLASVLSHDKFVSGELHTGFVDEHLAALVAYAQDADRSPEIASGGAPGRGGPAGVAGAQIDHSDPLAVLDYGQRAVAAEATVPAEPAAASGAPGGPDGTVAVTTPLQGTIVSVQVAVGDTVHRDQTVVVMEAMKMEHEIVSSASGVVRQIDAVAGQTFFGEVALLFVEPVEMLQDMQSPDDEIDLDHIREDLAYVLERHEMVLDQNRPEAVAKRRKTGNRTARENVSDLVDDGSFVEYGPMVVAAQKSRRTLEELLVKSPADGMITGVGSVNGDLFDEPTNRCAVMAYDYTVFAGTQGLRNHAKTDRLLQVTSDAMLPLIIFAEGGGGRPGDDTDGGDFGTSTFGHFASLSGLVPMIAITTGYCFAGNASLLGCCDVVIATAASNIGMGGPAMVEGGGLGVFSPKEIGPLDVQVASGVVDVEVADEAEAVTVAKKYLSYFQGRISDWEAPDQRQLRAVIPENRLRVYEIRDVIDTLADVDSVLELRRGFGPGMVTSLIRLEGRPVGVVANDPKHLGGAIDSDGSDKAARFMQLCDAYDIPLLLLCDTPGIMVGPDIEQTGLVRKSSRMFVTSANLRVPAFTIFVRKAYGLGAIAMAAGSMRNPMATISWPTGEFGPMGLEGSVKLGYRAELAAIEDRDERQAFYDNLVERAYEGGKAHRRGTGFSVDDVIDPADSRHWLTNLLAGIRPGAYRGDDRKKRPFIDTW